MKFDLSGLAAMLVSQVANLTRDEQRKLAEHLALALATVVRSSRTSIDDVAVRALVAPFAKDFITALEANL